MLATDAIEGEGEGDRKLAAVAGDAARGPPKID